MHSSPLFELFSDACLTGLDAFVGGSKTGGRWAHRELDHINCLELKAILFSLQSLYKDWRDTHIHLWSDDTTAIACLNHCGSTKVNLNTLIEVFFSWAESHGIFLSEEHINGLHNVDTNRE